MGKWRIKEHFSAQSIVKTLGLIVLGIAVVALFTSVLTGLWNWLLPDLFGFKTITPLQGLGIFILSKIIFGGFGGSSNEGGNGHNQHRDYEDKKVQLQSDTNNSNYDQLYERWWSNQGEKQFEAYVDQTNKDE